jgi:hypothetical protein
MLLKKDDLKVVKQSKPFSPIGRVVFHNFLFEATRKQWQRNVVEDQNDTLYEHVYTSEVATFVL